MSFWDLSPGSACCELTVLPLSRRYHILACWTFMEVSFIAELLHQNCLTLNSQKHHREAVQFSHCRRKIYFFTPQTSSLPTIKTICCTKKCLVAKMKHQYDSPWNLCFYLVLMKSPCSSAYSEPSLYVNLICLCFVFCISALRHLLHLIPPPPTSVSPENNWQVWSTEQIINITATMMRILRHYH